MTYRAEKTGTGVSGKLGLPVGDADAALLLDKQPSESGPAIELLTISEAAEFLRISASGIRRLQQGRHIPFFKVGGSVRLSKSDLVSYLAQHRIGSIGK